MVHCCSSSWSLDWLLQLLSTTTTVLYSYNDQMDCCCWTCSGHLQENHEIELNTNLSVDTLCVLHSIIAQFTKYFKKRTTRWWFSTRKKASISWWTSNDDQYARNFKFRTNRYTNILINVILIVRLHIFPSQIKEDRDVEKKCLFRKHAEKFANL